MTHSTMLIIPVTLPIAADIPLCTEIITVKDRNTMIKAIVRKIAIFHIMTIMINTVSGRAGARIIKATGMSMTEIMIRIMLIMTIITASNTEIAVANTTMATTGTTTASTAGTIIT